MCGIVGLFAKSHSVEERLGEHLGTMLGQMCDRGPDSAGVAFYRDAAPAGACRVSLFSDVPGYPWEALADELAEAFGGDPNPRSAPATPCSSWTPKPARCRRGLSSAIPSCES